MTDAQHGTRRPFGVVVFDEHGTPIQGASVTEVVGGAVRRDARSEITDRDGRVSILAFDYAWLRVIAERRCPRIIELRGYTGDVEVEVALLPGSPHVVHALDAQKGTPIPGVYIYLSSRGDGYVPLGETDSNGTIELPGVGCEEETEIFGAAAGYCLCEKLLARPIETTAPASTQLRMVPSALMIGVVEDWDGRPVGGARIEAVPLSRMEDEIARASVTIPEDPEAQVRVLQAAVSSGELDTPTVSITRATTAADGHFELDHLQRGERYLLHVWAAGCAQSERASLAVPEFGEIPAARLQLTRSASVIVEVSGEDGPHELMADVHLLRGMCLRGSGRLSGNTCSFAELEPSRYHILVKASGYLPAAISVDLTLGQKKTVALRLRRGASIAGVVFGPNGAPVRNAVVQIAPQSSEVSDQSTRILEGARVARTDLNGRFRVDDLADGRSFVLRAESGDDPYVAATPVLHVVHAPTPDLVVRLTQVGGARLQLTRPEGVPFTDGISFKCDDHPWKRAEVSSGGVVVVPRLAAGKHTLVVAPDGFAWTRVDVVIEGVEHLDLGSLGLFSGFSLDGKVVDSRSAPIQGAVVRLLETDNRVTIADAAGAFRLRNLPNGLRWILASAPGFCDELVALNIERDEYTSIVMLRPALLSGRVLSMDGRRRRDLSDFRLHPIPTPSHWEEANLVPFSPWQRLMVVLNPDGEFRELEMRPGKYEVRIEGRENAHEVTGPISLAEGEARTLELRVP